MVKKILIGAAITVGAIFALMILFGLTMFLVVSVNNRSAGSKEEILNGSQQASKKALVIYQPSKSDISSQVAHQIAKGLNAGGYEVTLNRPGDYLSNDISKYSVVVFGSPVFAGQISKALTNYMSKAKVSSSNKIVLYSTGSIQQTTELDNMEKFLNGSKAFKKVKFYTSAKTKNDKLAYDLGTQLSKE